VSTFTDQQREKIRRMAREMQAGTGKTPEQVAAAFSRLIHDGPLHPDEEQAEEVRQLVLEELG
jgi:hypothetical protein